ncbi:hypothetical protein GNP92_11145 [Paenibacillus timonensis]|nr:hypothetical protein [Paenibacillus timonensis]MUG86896.1 hypothetical protein [Paenibacillus timonensis]
MSMDELLKDLQGQRTMEEDPSHISLSSLFHESFMRKHSSHNSFEEFLEKGNFQAETHEDINNINDELLNRHVVRETDFASWNSMLDTATKEYSEK